MEISTFYEKLNKVDGNIYVIEEEIHLVDGVYEAELQHDNINTDTLSVWTGPKLTGERLESYTLSTPSLAPWKRIVRVYADVPVVYISYETDGDTVEGDDINRVQEAIVTTQEALNAEENRALGAEKKLTDDLQAESNRAEQEENRLSGRLNAETERAQAAETVLQDNLSGEVSRAKEAEKANRAAITAEANRAKAAEKVNTDAITAESNRAQAAETTLQENIDGHTDAVNLEIQSLRSADTALEEKKANTADVNRELGNRYTKDQVYTKAEVLKKIEDLIGAAPDTLDTFREIADALGNDPNFATTIMTALGGKVDKVAGKQLSSNDYTDAEKTALADVNNKKHTHGNKSVLDKLTEILLNNWTDAYNKRHEHGNKTVIDKITQPMLDKLAGIAEGANKYVHPTTAGNKHIPSGGASGQFLKWSADGTAVWAADNNTTYSDMKGATASAAGVRGLVPAPTAGKQGQFLRGDGTWAVPPSASYTHPNSGVAAGTYRSVTVNAQGHVTAGTNPTTLSGYGITDAALKSHNHDGAYLKKSGLTWGDLKGV